MIVLDFSPAFLNFGRELVVPKSIYEQLDSPPVLETDDNNQEEANTRLQCERIQKLQETFELVRLMLNRAFNKQSHHYNLRRRDWRCKVGDRVMKLEHPLSNAYKGFAAKLAPRYSGPFTIVKVISPVLYDLKGPDGKILRKIHIQHLKAVNF